MTNKEVNDCFVKIIPMLEVIVKGLIYKNRKKIDVHAAINEAYLHLMNNKEILTSEDKLQRVVIKFLRDNIYWTNSKLNKIERVNTTFELEEEKKDNNYKSNYRTTDDDDEDFEFKLGLEKWYIERKCTLDMYRAQEEDPIKQIIFDCYFRKGIRTSVS